jgi:natural product precursor
MKKSMKKLSLNKITIPNLTAPEMKMVLGGKNTHPGLQHRTGVPGSSSLALA